MFVFQKRYFLKVTKRGQSLIQHSGMVACHRVPCTGESESLRSLRPSPATITRKKYYTDNLLSVLTAHLINSQTD